VNVWGIITNEDPGLILHPVQVQVYFWQFMCTLAFFIFVP